MISEEKKRIVIGNCFNVDCDIDTTIREAYELGFDRGIEKASPVVRRDVLKQVLETIDGVNEEYMAWHGIIKIIRDRVMALKGEQV